VSFARHSFLFRALTLCLFVFLFVVFSIEEWGFPLQCTTMVHCFRFISKCSILCTNCVERKIGVIIVFVLSYYVSLCSYLFHYDLPLPPVVYMRAIVLFTLFMYVWCSGVQHILCCAILFYLRLVSCVPNVASFSGFSILDCPFCFLWIVHSWLALPFSLSFILTSTWIEKYLLCYERKLLGHAHLLDAWNDYKI
jgi:hypothetical protein